MALSENPTLEEIVNEIERLNNLILDRGGERIITPTTTNQILAKGNYKGDITVLGDDNLVSGNILSGKSIFGVQGSVVKGRKWASGTTNSSSNSYKLKFGSSTFGNEINCNLIEVNNLDFNPSIVIAYLNNYTSFTDSSFVTLYIRQKYSDGVSCSRIDNTSSDQGTSYRFPFKSWGNDKTGIHVSYGGFKLPVIYSNSLFAWIAFE